MRLKKNFIIPFLIFAWSCKTNHPSLDIKNSVFVSDFSTFDLYYYKIKGFSLVGGVSIHFKEEGAFDFEFQCSNDVYSGTYKITNDTIFITNSNIPLPNKFLIKNKNKIYGELYSDSIKHYFFSFVRN